MNPYLLTAGALSAATGVAHSVLGERFILTRLRALPPVLGSEEFTRRILRFAWHITTLLLVGIGVLLVMQARNPAAAADLVARVFAVTFLLCAVLSGTVSRGRHFSWAVFLAIALLLWFGAPRLVS